MLLTGSWSKADQEQGVLVLLLALHLIILPWKSFSLSLSVLWVNLQHFPVSLCERLNKNERGLKGHQKNQSKERNGKEVETKGSWEEPQLLERPEQSGSGLHSH